MRRILLLTLLVALAIATAAGCGGGSGGGNGKGNGDGGGAEASGIEPKAYASKLCGSIGAWRTRLQTSANKMTADLRGATDPNAVKKRLVSFLGEAVTSTDTMIGEVEAAGAPDVDNGDAMQRDVLAGLKKARTAFQQAKDKAAKISASDPVAFQRQAGQLGQTLQAQGTSIATTFDRIDDKYHSKDIDEAFTTEPACKRLTGAKSS